MNGTLTPIFLSVIAGMLGLVNLLFGLLLKAHKDSDDERWRQLHDEIGRLRDRLHDLTATVGKVDQWQRFKDEDQKDD